MDTCSIVAFLSEKDADVEAQDKVFFFSESENEDSPEEFGDRSEVEQMEEVKRTMEHVRVF